MAATGDDSAGAPAPPPRPVKEGLTFAGLSSITGVVLLALLSLQRGLRLPSGYGIEDLLGWRHEAVVAAAREVWCANTHGGWAAAVSYVLVDTGLFAPCYLVLIHVVAANARALLSSGQSLYGRLLSNALYLTGFFLAALVLVDLAENLGGVMRLGAPVWTFVAALVAGIALAVALARLTSAGPRPARRRDGATAAAAVFIVGAVVCWAYFAKARYCLPGAAAVAAPLAWAHHAKGLLLLLTILFPGLAFVAWWYGTVFDLNAQRTKRNAQAAMRMGVIGIVGRSRYVLLTLLFYAALMLGLDQARDVMLALADIGNEGPLLWRAAVFVSGGLSIVMMSYSCWMWTRLGGMIKRPGLELKVGRVRPDPALYAFARTWARLLATIPLVIVCVLIAFAIGDLAFAARRSGTDDQSWVLEAATLIAFAVGTVGTGAVLIFRRRTRSLLKEADYYNSEHDVRRLIWKGTAARLLAPRRGRQAWDPGGRIRRTLRMLITPFFLPVMALVAMAGLRGFLFLRPEVAATVPAGLAILTLALVWWMGVLGALSLFEQRHAVPFILFPVAVVGFLAFNDWTDNHRLAWEQPPVFRDGVSVLPMLRGDGSAVVLVLVAACLLAWVAALLPSTLLGRRRLPKLWVGRWVVGLLGFVVAVLLLVHVDQRALQAAQSAADSVRPGSVLRGAAARTHASPVARPPASASPEPEAAEASAADIILVAAEGGGIRSAYWTAKALVELHARLPGFDRHAFLLSGVSGGSMGIAVYRACLARAAAPPGKPKRSLQQDLRSCVDAGLDRLDGLSPLLGALMFEDVLGKLLPTGLFCNLPGCGHLSRALLFERAWMEALPELAMPLSSLAGGRPHVAFNSTWIESGNRTVASSLAFAASSLPSATRLKDCLRVDLSLLAAAHTSARFPYINPLASAIPLAVDTSVGCRKPGHLIDGGYFDNSGTATLIDTIRLLHAVTPERSIRTILIRNGQSEPECGAPYGQGDEPPPNCFESMDLPRTSVPALGTPLDRRRWSLYADELGPVTALLNVSGVGAHGRHAPGQLGGTLPRGPDDDACKPVLLIEQIDDGALVPLGWYLSNPARRSLDTQLDAVIRSTLSGCSKDREGE